MEIPKNLTSLTDFYSYVNQLPIDEVRKGLSEYMDNELLSFIEKSRVVDLRRLYAFSLWVKGKVKLNSQAFGKLEDPEEGFLTLELYIHCKDEEWGEIARKVKEEINREGFSDVARKVLIVCVEGMKEVLH